MIEHYALQAYSHRADAWLFVGEAYRPRLTDRRMSFPHWFEVQ